MTLQKSRKYHFLKPNDSEDASDEKKRFTFAALASLCPKRVEIPHAYLAKKWLLVGESNPGRLRDRQKCYQLHQRGLATPTRFELARAA